MTDEIGDPFSIAAISVLGIIASRTGALLNAKIAETSFRVSRSILPSRSPSAIRANISRLEKRRFLLKRSPWVNFVKMFAIEEVTDVIGKKI